MNILELAILKKMVGGGGGSGTDNYNDLSNLPKINDTTLSGNKTSANLGLQSEINSDSKLASDLVDDTNQDNKFVTSTEKNTWNAKQNAIDADHKLNADYVDDSTSTNKFVTSSDKETWNAKQNAIDADHKLSSSLVSFTTAEAAALASGIDSAKVAQISTNQSNISYVSGKAGKNLFEFTVEGLKQRWDSGTWNGNTFTSNFGVTIVVNDNKSIVVTGTPNTQTSLTIGIYDHTKYKGCIYSGGTSNVSTTTCISGVNNINYDYGDGVTMTVDTDRAIQIAFFTGTNLNITFKPMICTAEDWAVGHDFAPYALPNYDLTRLEAEDRAALAEEIDAGAKNKVDIASITTTGSSYVFNQLAINALPAGSYVFSYSSTQSDSGDIQLVVTNDSTTLASVTITSKSGSNSIPFTINGTATKLTLYSVRAGTYSNFMLCTKAAFGVSQKFVPYCRTTKVIADLYKEITGSTTLTNTGLEYNVESGAKYRITAYAEYGSSNPLEIVIVQSNGVVLGQSEVTSSSGVTIGYVVATGYIYARTARIITLKARFASATSNYVGMIIEKL